MSKKKRRKIPVRRNENDQQVKSQAKTVRTEQEKSTRKTSAASKRNRPTSPTARKEKRKRKTYSAEDMLFGRENYTYMIAGLVLMIIGFS